jgi:hypothetical protein
MIDRIARAAMTVLILAALAPAQEPTTDVKPSGLREVEASGRQVLVELYTSQGCNYCPTAERLLQEMASRGYGPDRVVPLAFHVDYFNTPWADPYSSRDYSSRQWAYNSAFKARDSKTPDLYFTPMVMVDGRYPMSGYHSDGIGPVWPHLKARLDRALRVRREASLTLTVGSPGDAPSLRDVTVRVRPKSARLVGKDLLICVVVTEGTLSTAVPSGENAGETLIEDHVVRRFLYEGVTLRRESPTEASFSLDLGQGWEPSRCEIVAFLQDQESGAIHQLATLPWEEPAGPAVRSEE